MSDTEQTDLLNDWKTFKRWYPVVLALGGLFMCGVTVAHYFDNNVATKSDIAAISKDLQEVKSELVDIKAGLSGYKETSTTARVKINSRIDSLGNIVSNIRGTLHTGFFTESYPHGRNGKPDINPVN